MFLYFVSCFGTDVWNAFMLCTAMSVTPEIYSFTGTFLPVTGSTVALGYPAHHFVPLLSVLSRSPKLFSRALNLAARCDDLEKQLTCKKRIESA